MAKRVVIRVPGEATTASFTIGQLKAHDKVERRCGFVSGCSLDTCQRFIQAIVSSIHEAVKASSVRPVGIIPDLWLLKLLACLFK